MCGSSHYTGFNVFETHYEHDSWVLIKMFILNIFSICLIFNAACVYMEKYICAVKDLYGSETNVHQ